MQKFNKFNDPELFAAAAHAAKRGLPDNHILVLALDLGTSTGYSLTWLPPGTPFDPEKHPVLLGQLDLSAGPYDSGAVRMLRLRHFLAVVRPNAIWMEDVKYTPPEMGRQPTAVVVARVAGPCEFFGALKGTVAAWGEEHHVPVEQVGIGVIKKRATGKGNASKEAVVSAANGLLKLNLTAEEIADATKTGLDNSCDAFWAMVVGLENNWGGLSGRESLSGDIARPERSTDPGVRGSRKTYDEPEVAPRPRGPVRPAAADGVLRAAQRVQDDRGSGRQ